MKKVVWLGLTAVGGAALVVGTASLLQYRAPTAIPTPPRPTSTVFVPGQPVDVPAPGQAIADGRASSASPTLGATADKGAAAQGAPLGFVAPVEGPLPAARAETDFALGVEGGIAGGVEGGVQGGIVGGVVGGLPSAPDPGRGRPLYSAPMMAPLAKAASPLELRMHEELYRAQNRPVDREGYDHISDNPFLAVAANPLSTFSIDVDTASYANVRRFLTGGRLPPKDAVRIEELVNYFRYDYPEPRGDTPFSISTEVARCPWTPQHRLALVGLRGRSLHQENVPPRNLTFLLDVSGSMRSADKLPLLQQAMGVLVASLREEDRVAIVVYAGRSGLVLPPTSGARKGEIRAAINQLRSGGSTAGGAGIQLAYHVAAESFIEGGVNRVILATDGDFNVGVSSEGDLVRLIEEKRKTGVFLSVLGFGQGNLQDSKMEKLADHGNGNYSYIDSFREAQKVLGSEAAGTLVTIAKDVKIQVEFNPALVKAYRLLGYENRALRAEDFADDRKDAGEIGAGHTVTALYEIVPVGVDIELPSVDPLKYQKPAAASGDTGSPELFTVKLRHKEPTGSHSRLTSLAVEDAPGGELSGDLRFASAVAAYGMLLRDSEHKGSASWTQVIDLARAAVGEDLHGHRTEFLVLARNAQALATMEQVAIAR